MSKIILNSTLFIMLPVWVLCAWAQKPLITGVESITRWTENILSSKNAMFFFNIMMIAAVGGFLASKYRHNKKIYILIQVVTLLMVILTGYITSQISSKYT